MRKKFSLKRKSQGGQTLVLFALAMLLFLVPVTAAVLDFTALAEAHNQADTAVTLASQAGAAIIDDTAYRQGITQIDGPVAKADCLSYLKAQLAAMALNDSGTATCSVDPSAHPAYITASVTVHPRVAVGSASWFTVSAGRTSYIATGTFIPGDKP